MIFLRVFPLLLLSSLLFAKAPDGGGAMAEPGHTDDRAFMERILTRARINSNRIKAGRGPVIQADPTPVELQWPVRKAITVTDPDVQAVSNFVDQDPSEGGLLDWNCGDRTYDGHKGLDIYLTPFSWYKMEQDAAIVVAAAPGTIVEKVNDQPERSCSSTDPSSGNNVITIEHADGSLAIYAHMRTNSLNAKSVGDVVTVGEYLGVVGSSGYSTGPHLHFEVGFWEMEQNAWHWRPRDPFAGTCNDLNVSSWWETQPAYYGSRLNAIATHDAPPEVLPCPETEVPHYRDSFQAGETVYFAAYYRDQLNGQNSHFRVILPNGSVFSEWPHASPEEHYSGSYWYWSIKLPGDVPAGEWAFEVTFEGQTLRHAFYVDAAPAALPPMPATNNAYNGSWFDPDLDGEGYNIVTSSAGTIIYFYGSDAAGQRMWLLSNVLQESIRDGKELRFEMYESTGGTHFNPVSSARGLSVWGELVITFSDCNNGTAVLRGLDGEKNQSIVKIIGVNGTLCVGNPSADGPYSGAWFDPATDGEGFNLIVTPAGIVIYYYGFDNDGNRLWFISDVMASALQPGQAIGSDLYKATTGTFDEPVPSPVALSKWGTVTLEVHNCSSMTVTMDTLEGNKVSAGFKIVGVAGLACVD